MKADDASWQKKIAKEEAEYAKASTEYDEVIKDVDETEAELRKATARLKKYRREPHVDDDGGVYDKYQEQSSTISGRISMCALAALLGVLLH